MGERRRCGGKRELVIEGLRVAANAHIEAEIDMIQIMDVGN